MSSYPTSEGRKLLLALIETIDTNGAYLSEIDGATGDGDHGINMTKGVRRTKEKLGEEQVTVPQGLDMKQIIAENIGMQTLVYSHQKIIIMFSGILLWPVLPQGIFQIPVLMPLCKPVMIPQMLSQNSKHLLLYGKNKEQMLPGTIRRV